MRFLNENAEQWVYQQVFFTPKAINKRFDSQMEFVN
jgi:hypothetical protein